MDNIKFTEKPTYFAIIPADVRYDKALSPSAKLLYCEITVLLNIKNKCFASNEYFARLFEISDVQVSRLIKQLTDNGYIETSIVGGEKGPVRVISLAGGVLNKNVKGVLNKNVKHNNKSLFDNKDRERKGFEIPKIEEVIFYFKNHLLKEEKSARAFFDFYQSKGWMVGKNKMKDWQAAARGWRSDEEKSSKPKPRQIITTNYVTN